MISTKAVFAALVFTLTACAAPKAEPPHVVRVPGSAPPVFVEPVFHSNKSVTRDELFQNGRVPAHRDFPLSSKINPCQNYYDYVCSEVKSTFTLPEDRSMFYFTFSDPTERLLAAKKNYLIWLQNKPNLTPRQKILKTNFAACMNQGARATEEKAFVSKELATITSLANLSQLQHLMSERMLTGDFSMMEVAYKGNDITNRDKYSVYFGGGEMTLPERSYYKDPAVREALSKLYALFFRTIGRGNEDARAKALLDLETRIADIKPLPAEMRPRYSDLKYIVSKEDLLKKFPALMLKPALDKIPKDIKIFDLTPEVTQLTQELETTGDLELLKDYILYHALNGVMDEAYPEFFEAKFRFSNQFLNGPPVRPELHERCAREVDGDFNFELAAELVPLVFSANTQKKVEAIAEKIRQTKLAEIKETKWISDAGRKGALEKMRKLRLMIFKPKAEKDWDFNATGVTYRENTFIQNAKNVAVANMLRDIRRLKGKRNHDQWGMAPTTVNAYYSPSENIFVLPAAIFQPPFYLDDAPEYMNIGSIGSVVGHEIGHSIDDQGSNFDANGEVRQWLSKDDLAEFHKHADDKLIKIFEKIVVADTPHIGKLTLGENIGDNVGLHSAYRTAFDHSKNAADVDKKKKFFEQYARTWCYVGRPKAIQQQLKTNPHAVGEGRVNGQVGQIDGFYEAYSCKPGDKMYVPPADRVNIW